MTVLIRSIRVNDIISVKKNKVTNEQFKFTLRKVKKVDARFLFNLRNDSEVRKNSFNKAKLMWNDHLVWFNKSLQNEDRIIYIFSNRKKIGQVRFDIYGQLAEIDIAVDRKFRGQGIGSTVIKFGSDYFLKQNRFVKIIIARIKEDNKASVFAHIKSGFKQIERKNGLITLEYTRFKIQ